jgi:hypothetical protein
MDEAATYVATGEKILLRGPPDEKYYLYDSDRHSKHQFRKRRCKRWKKEVTLGLKDAEEQER